MCVIEEEYQNTLVLEITKFGGTGDIDRINLGNMLNGFMITTPENVFKSMIIMIGKLRKIHMLEGFFFREYLSGDFENLSCWLNIS